MSGGNTADASDRSTPRRRQSNDDGLKSLVKVVRVLECFTTNQRSLSLAEICAETGFPRSTSHRLLASMREVGFLEQDRERDRYRLGLRLFEFGNIVLANLDLHREARPIVDALQRMTNRAVHLAVFDGLRAVVVQHAEPSNESSLPIDTVENAPAYCTGVGKAILAYQPDEVLRRLFDSGLRRFTDATITDVDKLHDDLRVIRERGYSIDDGEHQPGLRCLGAPIYNQNGAVFASVSVSGPAWQLPINEMGDLSKVVKYHADLISQRLGYVEAKADTKG